MKPTLIIIDMQKYFLTKNAPAFLQNAPKIVPNVLKLIEKFRAKELPVIFTRHAHKKGKPTGEMGRFWNNKLQWEGTKWAELIGEFSPHKNEVVIAKTKYSAFEETKLDKILQRKKVDTVVLCGVMTNMCVETTARHAFIKDYRVVVVKDACAANTVRHHNAAIMNLSYGFADIVKTKEVSLSFSRGGASAGIQKYKRSGSPSHPAKRRNGRG